MIFDIFVDKCWKGKKILPFIHKRKDNVVSSISNIRLQVRHYFYFGSLIKAFSGETLKIEFALNICVKEFMKVKEIQLLYTWAFLFRNTLCNPCTKSIIDVKVSGTVGTEIRTQWIPNLGHYSSRNQLFSGCFSPLH